MDVGLLVACLSFGVAALSLGWQIAVWSLDGRRVRLSLTHGAMGRGGAATGKVARDGRPADLDRVRAEGFTGREVIGVSVTNLGRAPVRVDRYSCELVHGGLSYTPIGDAIGPPLPFRLAPGETETWYALGEDARALVTNVRARHASTAAYVVMSVQLGTGDVRRTRRHLDLDAAPVRGR